jgi:hypothetical protein
MRKSRSGKGVRGSAVALVVAFVSAVALVALSPRASRAQECLLEFRQQTGGLVTDGSTLCQTATGNKCTFELQVCVNALGCAAVDLKHKNIRALGHCGPVGKVHVKGSGTSSLCGEFAGVNVRTKNHGKKAGNCKIHAKAGTDRDTITLTCQPSSSPCAATTTTTTTPGATTTTMIGGGQAPVALGSAANFAVLAGSTVTNAAGATTVTGDLGVSPGTAVTGFPPGTVIGTTHAGDAAAAQAQMDLTTAFNDAAGRSVGAVTVAGNLGGQTLTPGLYKSTSSLEISSGDLTLDAQGNANAVFIFQMASTLTTTAGRQVILSGSAKAANVVWQVGSSATLGTTSVFAGNILADQSITLNTGATLDGRALARIAAVGLDTNTITTPAP